MFFKKLVFWILGALIIITFSSTSALAAPVLIKLKLTTQSEYQKAQFLEVVPYQKFGEIFLAEIGSEKLEELRVSGLEYEVVDGDPWSEEYFIVSAFDRAKQGPIPKYGRALIEEQDFNLLKADWDQALRLQKMGFKVVPIPHRPIPLKYSPPLMLHKEGFEYSEDLDSLVDLISQDSLWTYVKRLQDYLSRFTWADSMVPAREWIYDKFVEFGCDSVYFDEFVFYDPYFEYAYASQYNVVGIVEGTVNPDKVIVVGGHYDSIVWNPQYLAYTQAPGADDNATGTVAAMEQARIIAENRLPCTVIFVAFAGEELGLWGAWDYADQAYLEEQNILLMMNYDMIGEMANESKMILFKDDPSLPYAQIFSQMASLYNTPPLTVQLGGTSGASDQWPFWQLGYNAFFAHEEIFSFQYHQPSDSITYLDFDYMEKVVRAGLATLVTVATYPAVVRGLDYVDAGDGERLYVNWLPNPENDLVSYNLYWGRRPNVYDSLRTIPATYTSDTLYDLMSDTTYYITVTASNDQGYESLVKTEITAAPRLIPAAPQGLATQTGFRKILLSWFPNKEADFDYYKIFRSTNPEGDFELLKSGLENRSYEDTTIGSGIWYYYFITAVDTTGLESPGSDIDSSQAVTLDQGILVIDETANGNGKRGNPSDAQQDSFYAEIFEGYNVHFYDYTYSGQRPPLEIIGPYSTVVWLDEDISHHYLHESENLTMISEYLDVGGNFLWCSWVGMERLSGVLPMTYAEGSFVYDYLHIQRADWNEDYDFIGAKAVQPLEYQDVIVDTSKLKSIWEGKLWGIVKLDCRDGAEPIYLYDSFEDSIAFEDSVCGIKYLGLDYGVIFLGFPLFYLEKEDAQGLIQTAMNDLGETATGIEEMEGIASVSTFVLSQNYPNPFNSSTLIPFKVNSSQSTVQGPIPTTVTIYNILGQKVKRLLDEEKFPGNYTVTWDGKDDRGEDVASGIYFYQLKIGDFQQSKKMLLLK